MPDLASEPGQVCEAQNPLLKGFLKGTAAVAPPTRLPTLSPTALSTWPGFKGSAGSLPGSPT